MAKKKKGDAETVVEEESETVVADLEPTRPAPRRSRLEAILGGDTLKAFRKKFGDETKVASETKFQKVHRIPTGILQLDVALGGGYTVGRISTNYGHKSSCKTTAYIKTLANAQKMCGHCWRFDPKCSCKGGPREVTMAWLDVEGTFDHDWAKCHGLDLTRLILPEISYAEQALDQLDGMVRGGMEDPEKAVDIIVLDSLAFLSPSQEIENDVNKDLMALQARLIGKTIRKINAGLHAAGNKTGYRATVLFTNQIRHKVGVMYGSPDTVPGGFAPGFAATSEIKFREGKYVMQETGAIHVATAGNFHFRIDKSKTSAPRSEGEFQMLLADTATKKKGEFVDEEFIFKEAKRLGVVDGRSIVGERFQNEDECKLRLETDPAFKTKVVDALWTIWAP